MVSKYNYNNITWIDLDAPTKEQVREVMEEFSLNPLVADELLTPTLRPKVDLHTNYIYLILHFPAITHTHGETFQHEIDFVIGKDFLITTHYEHIDPLHEFSKIFEVNSILDKSNIGDHAGFISFYIIRDLYRNLMTELDGIDARLEKIEDKIFKGRESEMVREISMVNRDLLNIRQAIRPHRTMLDSFELAGVKFFGQDFSYHLKTITGEFYEVSTILEGHKETLVDLRETNDSLLTTKTNEKMKTLTIIAFITFPLTLIAGIFGMNTVIAMPFIGSEYDFWMIIGLMLTSTLLMSLYFKYKKWI